VNAESLRRWVAPVLATTILLVVLLFVFPFGPGYTTQCSPMGPFLWSTWTTVAPDSPDYTYCLFVPIIAAYLIFTKRFEMGRARLVASTASIGWIIFGLLLFWIGSRTGKQLFGEAGLQVLLLGVVLWFWGGAVFRLLAFTWAFLLFAWPTAFVNEVLAFPLRMIVCSLASQLLSLVGVPCIQQGTALLSAPDQAAGLPLGSRFQIDITDPCSGLHMLSCLLMFSALYSYFFLPRHWQQWTVFFSTIPLTIVGNIVRILLLVTGCLTYGEAFALGTNEEPSWFHEACGYAVFAVVLGLEVLLAQGLIALEQSRAKRVPPVPQRREEQAMAPEGVATEARVGASAINVPWWRSGVVLGLAIVMLIAYGLAPNRYSLPKAGVVMSLPDEVVMPGLNNGKLYGFPAPVTEVELNLLAKNTEFARKTYDDFRGHNVFFSIVLSALQRDYGASLHMPEVCLVAQGWTIKKEEFRSLRLASGHTLEVRSLNIHQDLLNEKGEYHPFDALYLYWYVADDMVAAKRSDLYLWSSWDLFLHNHVCRWASVAVMSPITQSTRVDGLNEAQTRAMLEEFIRQVVPVIQTSEIPGSIAN
jgi:EpsI family protein